MILLSQMLWKRDKEATYCEIFILTWSLNIATPELVHLSSQVQTTLVHPDSRASQDYEQPCARADHEIPLVLYQS